MSEECELRLLARLHYALAVLTALVPLVTFPVLQTGVGLLRPPKTPPAAFRPAAFSDFDSEERVWRSVLGKLAVGGVAAITAVCLVHGAVLWYIGRQIAARRRRLLVMIFSVFHLINLPLGTALSLFTFVVLGRDRILLGGDAAIQR